MWRHYLGAGCLIYGVDIEPACKSYENEYVKIFIGIKQIAFSGRSFEKKCCHSTW